MKVLLTLIIAFGLSISAAFAQSITITGPNRSGMLEGETYTITWSAPGVESVSVVAHGARTPMGGASRGNFRHVVAEGVPAGQGGVSWRVPWIDAVEFYVKAKGYNAQGQLVATDEAGYGFRPAVLANRTADGLYLDLHNTTNQRLYRQQDYELTHAYLTTSSHNYYWRPPGAHVRTPHDHDGVFSVIEKERMHWSELYDVEMWWAMRYHGGHFIHATSSNLYDDLGGPASHGCNRLTRTDARELYHMTPLGTRVEVIGPAG